MKKLFFLFSLIFTVNRVFAQCDIQLVQKNDASCHGCADGSIEVEVVASPVPGPTPETCTNCTVTYSGNTTDVNVPSGQTHCLTATNFTAGINISGGTLIVCGNITPSWINMNNGRLVISGEANFSYLSVNQGNEIVVYGSLNANQMGISGTVTNHGTIETTSDLSVHSGATFTNTGTVDVTGSFSTGANLINSGTIEAGNVAFQSATTLGGTVVCNNQTSINAALTLQQNAWLQTVNILVYHAIAGPSQGCALVSVSNSSTIGATFSGNLSFCDPNGLETVYTTNPASFYNCNCNPAELNCSLTWNTGQTGPVLQNIPAGTYSVTTSGCNCSITESYVISEPAPTSAESYASLYKKLSGGYYVADNDELNFIFREDYSVSVSGTLPYKIYNSDNAEVTASLQSGTVSLGDNRYKLNVSALAQGFYILEVENAKGEKWFLRFRVD